MQEYVLILGAGLMQRPAIEAARQLGYRALVVDANPHAVCVPFADRFEPVDLKDREGLLALARSLGDGLAGVFTAGTDFSASVSYVAEQCGLPAHPFEAAVRASDKSLMRGCFASAGVASPSFRLLERSQIASFLHPETFSTLRFPSVVKPIDNMGARGCRLIRSPEEFLPSVEEAARNSRSGSVVLEDYMEGPEFSIDAIVYDGTLTVTGFADRHIFYSPYFIEMGHTMPSAFDPQKRLELIRTFAEGVAALGLTCGVAKADIKYTAQGPMVGEIAARLSGGYMSGWTYPYASGLNLTEEAMRIAVGKEPGRLLSVRVPLSVPGSPLAVYDVPCSRVSAERAWVSMPGKVAAVCNAERARVFPFVRDVFFRAGEGDAVDFPRNNVEKCGNAISCADVYEAAVQGAEGAVASLVLRLEPQNPATDAFLAGLGHSGEQGFPPDAYALPPAFSAALEEWLASAAPIAPDSPVAQQIPACLADCADTLKDWNHRSMRQSLELFDALCPVHGELAAAQWWHALIRGGVQGILYVADRVGGA